MFVLEQEDRILYDRLQERNLARQYDLLINCIEIGNRQGARSFDKYLLWSLNAAAVANISQFGGRFREEPVYLKDHKPPHFDVVPKLMDQFVSTVQENWFIWSEYTLASYVLWRLNWIHPFIEGNGRTARAACYYILCTKFGGLPGGSIIVPERIRHDRTPYYEALAEADREWDAGELRFPKMEAYLARLVDEQVMDIPIDEHSGETLTGNLSPSKRSPIGSDAERLTPGPPGPAGLSYADSGVDIDAGNAMVEAIRPLVRSTRRPGADAEIGGFGGLFDLKAAGFTDPILVAANDGVGTKVKIAIETGLHDTIGIDLVAMCVNDIVVQGAEPLLFLDYYATGKLDGAIGAAIVRGVAEGCRRAGCALIGGETAEMPGLYRGGDYDLAGFAVGAAERGTLLPRPDVRAGDVLLGLPSSGVHSNGFSLVRRIAERAGLGWSDPAPFADGRALGEALLEPTRIYVKPLLAALRDGLPIKALAHITGGGFPDNIPRVLPDGLGVVLDLAAVAVPPVFGWLARAGDVAPAEMIRTFNCGIGMVAVVPAGEADAAMAALRQHGEAPIRFGEITRHEGGERVATRGSLAL